MVFGLASKETSFFRPYKDSLSFLEASGPGSAHSIDGLGQGVIPIRKAAGWPEDQAAAQPHRRASLAENGLHLSESPDLIEALSTRFNHYIDRVHKHSPLKPLPCVLKVFDTPDGPLSQSTWHAPFHELVLNIGALRAANLSVEAILPAFNYILPKHLATILVPNIGNYTPEELSAFHDGAGLKLIETVGVPGASRLSAEDNIKRFAAGLVLDLELAGKRSLLFGSSPSIASARAVADHLDQRGLTGWTRSLRNSAEKIIRAHSDPFLGPLAAVKASLDFHYLEAFEAGYAREAETPPITLRKPAR